MMSSVFTDNKRLMPALAADRLAEEIGRQPRVWRESGRRLVRIEAPVESIDQPEWLAGQAVGGRLYWTDRLREFACAGVGVAAVIEQDERIEAAELFARAREVLGGESEARFYGGMRFDDRRQQGGHWRKFGAARFVLPRFELVRRGKEAVLAVNVRLPEEATAGERIVAELRRLQFGGMEGRVERPRVVRRIDTPKREEWMATVLREVEEIRAGRMEKIVLARESRFELEATANAVGLAGMLEAAAPGCFVFCHELPSGTAFLGGTPERLYYRQGRTIESEALAGTRRRGETEEEDLRLGEKLLASQKEAREQGFVAEAVGGTLRELCRAITGGDRRELVKLAWVQHMVTRFAGELEDGIGDAEILTRLHPTPAVGGVPKGEAWKRIRELEGFDRGWYAGPVGWIGSDSAEFAVGIRSALAAGATLRLYSGAGIVEGSHPDKEWDEIENKIDNFLKLLGSL